ncbi:unnamed protein product [Sphagnum balticum]
MVRQRKTTPAAPIAPGLEPMTPNETINIADYCKAQNLSEQSFRLVLENIRPDDFDSIKLIPQPDLDYVLATLTATLPATNNPLPIAESPAIQALEPNNADSTTPKSTQSPETQPQQGVEANGAIVANSGIGGLTQNQTNPQGANITLLDELIAASEEEIKLADLVSQFKTQQIIQNQQARDAQLVSQLREQRLNTRQGYFGALRDLQATTIDKPELMTDNLDFEAEITRLSVELGKQLVING